MLEGLKSWIVNICTTVFFITAVEMLLPSNKMKKYAKFVLGLILITVVISPFIKIFDKNFNIDQYVVTATDYFENKEYENNYDKCKTDSIDSTVNVFSKNLEKVCKEKLKEKFPKDNYEVLIDTSFNDEKDNFVIDSVRVGITDKKIKKIKRVVINENKEANKKEIENTKESNAIKKYVSEILSISKEKIIIYKI